MIKSLQFSNFQSHKDSELFFHPGVNVIVGESDSGKTAILRALKWILTNRPGGDAFRSSWGGDTAANISIDNINILRSKTKNINNYLLIDNLKKSILEFKAFGTDIPEEIRDALNMNEINLQNQLDLPFLLRDSPGQVAAHFNKIAHLDSIDKSMQLIEKWIRALGNDIKSAEKHLEERQEALSEYDYLPEMEKDIEDAEWMQTQYVDKWKKLEMLIVRRNAVIRNQERIDQYQPLLTLEKQVDSAYGMIQQVEEAEQKRKKLDYLKKQIQVNEHKQKTLSITIQNESHVVAAMDMMSNITQKQVEVGNLKKVVEHEKEIRKKIQRHTFDVQKWEDLFHQEIGTTCPLCGQEVA